MKSFDIRNELFMDEFVIMPNHIHGIVVIDGGSNDPVETNGRSSLHRASKSVSSFLAGFKSATVNEIDNYIDVQQLDVEKFNRENKLWQRNYWDRIIRDEKEYENMVTYIANNPIEWEYDSLNELNENGVNN